MHDRIEKEVVVPASITRVWRAVSDHNEFGTWFQVQLDGPFVLGELTEGQITVPGFEHLAWKSSTTALEPKRLFAFTWNPYDYEPYEQDLSEASAPPSLMLVEFQLEPTPEGTRIRISESGFASLPDDERREAIYQRNEAGWNQQIENISAYLDASASSQ